MVIFPTESKKKEDMKKIKVIYSSWFLPQRHQAMQASHEKVTCILVEMMSASTLFHVSVPSSWFYLWHSTWLLLLLEPLTVMGVRQHSEYRSAWVWQNGRRMTGKRRENRILSEGCRNIKSSTWQEITPNPTALNMNHCNELSVEVYPKTVQKLSLVKTQSLFCLWQSIIPSIYTDTQGIFACGCLFWYLICF